MVDGFWVWRKTLDVRRRPQSIRGQTRLIFENYLLASALFDVGRVEGWGETSSRKREPFCLDLKQRLFRGVLAGLLRLVFVRGDIFVS